MAAVLSIYNVDLSYIFLDWNHAPVYNIFFTMAARPIQCCDANLSAFCYLDLFKRLSRMVTVHNRQLVVLLCMDYLVPIFSFVNLFFLGN
jgi:hypothetical protein